MKIGIAGIGGIGSNVAALLVRGGVRRLKLVDFDRVDGTNLNRQFYFRDQIGRPKVQALAENLLRIAPGSRIESLVLRLESANVRAVFEDCDAIVEGFDGGAEKKRLVEALASSDRLIVSASGVAGTCLEGIRTRRLGPCTIIGDFCTDAQDARCYPPKVALVAALMAHEILAQGELYE